MVTSRIVLFFVFAVVVVVSFVVGSMPVSAELRSGADGDLAVGRERFHSLQGDVSPVRQGGVPGKPIAAGSDAGLEQIQQVCSEAATDYALSALVTENFVLLHCGNDQWAASTGNHLERTYERFHKLFKESDFSLKPLDCRLTWICFGNTEDYYGYAWQTERRDVSALEGYYSAQTNRVALYETSPAPSMPASPAAGAVVTASASEPLGAGPALLDSARSTHEAAHQLAFNTGLQRRGVMYPFWLSEGLATAFEDDPADPMSALEVSERRRRLLDARAVNALIPFGEFSVMSRIPMDDMGRVYDGYAQAWGFYTFLFENHRSELSHYFAHLQSLAPGRRSAERMRREFADSFGALRPLEKQWTEYLDSLERAAGNQG